MLEIHKQYVFDENGKAIVVQIPIDEFKQIEEILNSKQNSTQINGSSASGLEAEDVLEEVDGLLAVKSQGVTISATIVEDLREERIREVGCW